MKPYLSVLGVLVLAGCAATTPAPVVERKSAAMPTPVEPVARIEASRNGQHVVARGDTLYAIAFANGLDHREIAVWNQLENADRILVGQALRLTPPPGKVEVRPLDEALPLIARPLDAKPVGVPLGNEDRGGIAVPAQTAQPSPATVPVEPVVAVAAWGWPTEGVLAARFGGAGGKGIDLVGPRGSEVRAAAAGKVVYSGTGLRGYGRLLIVKHAGEFLSAYAHNESVLVKEGDSVAAGQAIARMGDSDADRVKLHFEIRRYGKPLDPLAYLPERS